MKKRLSRFLAIAGLWCASSSGLAAPSPGSTSAASAPTTVKSTSGAGTFGLSYFTFFDGPGLSGDPGVTPNWLGRPLDDGLSLFNLISLKYRFTDTLALDFQARVQVLLNNGTSNQGFQQLRWQSPRIGISGKLLSGKDWTLVGAVNTDFPYQLPAPLGGGWLSTQRTVVFNPGMFASFTWKPSGSKWSVNTLLTPRYFFYADRAAAEPQLTQGGLSPGLKPELALQFSPSAIYSFTEKFGARVGVTLDYRKLVLSGWNPFSASLNTTDTNSESWRLWAMPLQVGFNWDISDAISVFPYVTTYPLAAQRVRRDGTRASFGETASVGMWINGTLF